MGGCYVETLGVREGGPDFQRLSFHSGKEIPREAYQRPRGERANSSSMQAAISTQGGDTLTTQEPGSPVEYIQSPYKLSWGIANPVLVK